MPIINKKEIEQKCKDLRETIKSFITEDFKERNSTFDKLCVFIDIKETVKELNRIADDIWWNRI